MRTDAPAIAPFLRSDAQGALLAELLVNPDRERTLTDLAELTGLPLTTVSREVTRLVDADFLVARNVGRARLVSPNPDHPLHGPMTQVFLTTYGPVPAVRDTIGSLPGVEQVFIYGSWAARMTGHTGAFPGDVDVLVIGDPRARDVYGAAHEAERIVRRDVNPTIVSRERWESSSSPLLADIRANPLVEVT